jgi:uncharacterized phage protein (TIGR02218 family)
MKIPWYESSPGALGALLFGRTFEFADLYTITLTSGIVLRYCTADVSISVNGVVWKHNEVRVDSKDKKATGHWKTGLDVDQWVVDFMPRLEDPLTGDAFPDKINGTPWGIAVIQGAFDGAQVQVDRAYFAAWPRTGALLASPVGVLTLFYGLMGSIDSGTTSYTLTINSHVQMLSTKRQPHVDYQAACSHTLFDAGCTLLRAAYAVPCTVVTINRNVMTYTGGALAGSGTAVLGTVTMTSGLNDGLSRTVRAWVAGTVTLIAPFPFVTAVGDTFDLYPGCAKDMVTCTLFSNLQNYGGEPFIPAAETAL